MSELKKRKNILTKKKDNNKKIKEEIINKNFQKKEEEIIWKKGEKVPYLALAQTFSNIEKISGRLKILEILSHLYEKIIILSPFDLLPTIYLSINKLSPDYEGLELGIGESILIKAIAEATGKTISSVKNDYNKLGDLGLVAQSLRKTQKTVIELPSLTIDMVYKKFREIANLQGASSVNKKKDIIRSLLVSCKENEAQYIIRSLQGKLRIHLAEKSVQTSLAHAFVMAIASQENKLKKLYSMKEAAEIISNVYNELPSYDIIIPTLLEFGLEELSKKCHLTPGIPLYPMLAQPTKGIEEVLKRLNNSPFTCEFKYDGERAQIHYINYGKEINIFSRNLENNTKKFPDIIRDIPKTIKEKISSFIIDCEIVAYDKEKQKISSFQTLTTRARKGVQLINIKVPICIFVFDLLFFNGEPLLKKTLLERRELLRNNFQEVPGEFSFVHYKDTMNFEEIQSFFEEAIENNCEGLVIKSFQSTYQPSKRSFDWLKIKKDYIEGMGDSFDLVVIGGYIGRGKRAGVYGAYLLAIYNEKNGNFESICKLGTGFTDEDLQKNANFFQKYIIKEPHSFYSFSEIVKPDVWFDCVQVWEVKAAEISLSPAHVAAKGFVDKNKGLALRFPRFIRIRFDKKPQQATTTQQVLDMYKKFSQNK